MGAEVVGQKKGSVAERIPVVGSIQGGRSLLLPKVGGSERENIRGRVLNY